MKKLIKFLLKAFFTLSFALVTSLILLFAIIAIIFSAFTPKPAPLKQPSILVFDLNTNIVDGAPASTPTLVVEELLGRSIQTLPLWPVIESIEAAAEDPNINALYLHGSLNPRYFGSGFGALREVRNAIHKFKSSGKPVYAYTTFPTLRDYYLLSTADTLYFNPYGMLFVPALAFETTYYGDALKRYGIGVQAVRSGDFKSATEPFTENSMSADSRKQLTSLMESLYDTLLNDISKEDLLSPQTIRKLSEEYAFLDGNEIIKHGFGDAAAPFDTLLDELESRVGRNESIGAFYQINLREYIYKRYYEETVSRTAEEIAIVYAEGPIVMGKGEYHEVSGERLARTLRDIRQDDTIKAVVLRINSPGGSATAAEMIAREVQLVQKDKPVVASFGSVAASGGYWIAALADAIFADPNSITGSIGSFGMAFNLQKIANDHGIHWDGTQTSPLANPFSGTKPLNAKELAQFKAANDFVDKKFIEKVAQGRGLEIDFVNNIAEGRAWSGKQAQALGLVDTLGGLKEAIAHAAELASIDEWTLSHFPESKNVSDAFSELFGEKRIFPVTQQSPVGKLLKLTQESLSYLKTFDDPKGLYTRLPYELEIN
ncbi:MAG TPA: signal peptide peptidase SppA [Opitutae bacterium]|nr:signal peptide peptidase SppA [Opitutae bacterium]|tara:strand:+ start:575 stop:2377 length:1803 start_codon:yes stop_codon:yes gene_type:complete